MTTTVLNTNLTEFEGTKIPDTSNLKTTIVLNTKSSEVENKIPDHNKYITSPEFNKLKVERFTARLYQANLVYKTNLITN